MIAKGFQGLDRETYKSVKKMDREQMTVFMAKVYFMGQDDLKEELLAKQSNIDLNGLREKLSGVKGVGEKRLNEIMDIIEKYVWKINIVFLIETKKNLQVMEVLFS